MSKELKPVTDRNGEYIFMTQFWGGRVKKECLQLTGTDDYITLDRESATELVEALQEWLKGERPEAEEEETS